uniref:RRM domain-containing protein n=1 Tax=Eptatretus burgeri TaxID=7764 RepID=A0A8C4WVY5_EPTBU
MGPKSSASGKKGRKGGSELSDRGFVRAKGLPEKTVSNVPEKSKLGKKTDEWERQLDGGAFLPRKSKTTRRSKTSSGSAQAPLKKAALRARGSKLERVRDSSGSKRKTSEVFVLFVGNLPFDVTKKQIVAHFGPLAKVKTVRLMTNKETGKLRGFAYIELVNKRAYKNAFQLHQSTMSGRKINVEYTSPGKPTTAKRERLQAKNKQRLQIEAQLKRKGRLAAQNRT